MSQETVAKNLQIQQNVYSKWESETIKLDDDKIEKLAKLFGVSIEDIKSPEPVLLNFTNCHNSGIHNNNNLVYNETNEKLIEVLKKQLIEKDEQIKILLSIIGGNKL